MPPPRPRAQSDPAALKGLRDPAMLARLPAKMLTDEQLNIVRNSNHTVPLLKGMLVVGQVEKQDADNVTVETGHRIKATVNRADISIGCLLGTSKPGAPRRTPYDVKAGDVVELVVQDPWSPYKGPWLDMPHRSIDHLYKRVFGELKAAHKKGIIVEGRVLNPVAGGYAVGIAGLVAFCPQSKASLLMGRSLGSLRKFTVTRIVGNHNKHVITLAESVGSVNTELDAGQSGPW